MENVADALKMAFAIFAFVSALSITIYTLTESRETADTLLLYSDKTAYWDKSLEANDGNYTRTVGIDTVISTIKNRGVQSSYVTVIEGATTYIFGLSNEQNADVEDFVKSHISRTDTYTETISEISLDGAYITAEDGTKLAIKPDGTTRRYIVYEKP